MPPILAIDHRMEAILRLVPIDRRSKVRFPLELPVRYRTLGREGPFAGVGSVVNLSSGGVLVAHQHEIRAGARMELNIEWPFLLNGQVPLQLVLLGRVVRCETSSFAVELGRYHFRTARRTVIPIDLPFNRMAKAGASA
jgi:hypothetical protein